MSRLGAQSGLVANQALSLPSSNALTRADRRAFLAFIDAANAKSDVQQQTGGIVGQEGARTGQLLGRAANPISTGTRTSPLDPANLNSFAESILARRTRIGPLEQFLRGGGSALIQTPAAAFDVISAVSREREAREDPADIIRLFDLQQRLRNEALRQQELELSRQRFVLSAVRAQRITEQAEQRANEGIAEKLAEDFAATTNVGAKEFGQLKTALGGGLPPDRALREVLPDAPPEALIAFERIAERGLQNPDFLDTVQLRLAAPRRTAAQRRKTEEQEAFRRLLDALDKGDREAVLEEFAKGASFEAQMLNAIRQVDPELAAEAGFLSRNIVTGGSGSGTSSSSGGSTTLDDFETFGQ